MNLRNALLVAAAGVLALIALVLFVIIYVTRFEPGNPALIFCIAAAALIAVGALATANTACQRICGREFL